MEGLEVTSRSRGPVCVAGMHGSGGPMVAQLLYRLGLHLGDGPFVAGPADPDERWSDASFARVNAGVLGALGGDWDVPPELSPGWERDGRLAPRREEARGLLAGFGGQEPWGWEDARSSLTLPFWLDLLPEARVVVCVRSPLEAADVLRERGVASLTLGLRLWGAYNETLRRDMPEGRCLVTHHDAYLYRPQDEIRRVLDFLGMPAADQLVSLVRSRVIRQARHRFFPLEDLETFDPREDLRRLYLDLCEMAEWNPDPASSPARIRA